MPENKHLPKANETRSVQAKATTDAAGDRLAGRPFVYAPVKQQAPTSAPNEYKIAVDLVAPRPTVTERGDIADQKGTKPADPAGTPPSDTTPPDTAVPDKVPEGNDDENNQQVLHAGERKPLTADEIDAYAQSYSTMTASEKKDLEDTLSPDELKSVQDKAKDLEEERTNPKSRTAGKVGLEKDPDWGKPLDEKFDIQQGDIIDFLMKDVVLASAAWCGQKITSAAGYGLYKAGSWAYHDVLEKGWNKAKEMNAETDKRRKKQAERSKDPETTPDNLKSPNDYTTEAAARVMALSNALLDKVTDPRYDALRFQRDLRYGIVDGNVTLTETKDENGKYIVEQRDDQGKVIKKHSVSEKTYKDLKELRDAVKNDSETAQRNGDDAEKVKELHKEKIKGAYDPMLEHLTDKHQYDVRYVEAEVLKQIMTMGPEEIKKTDFEKMLKDGLGKQGALDYLEKLDMGISDDQVNKDFKLKPHEISGKLYEQKRNEVANLVNQLQQGNYKEKGKDPNFEPKQENIYDINDLGALETAVLKKEASISSLHKKMENADKEVQAGRMTKEEMQKAAQRGINAHKTNVTTINRQVLNNKGSQNA